MFSNSEYVLEVRDISKSFPGVKALDKVQLKVRAGTVHGIMGENGAGKSTLMKIIAGIYQPDSGEYFYKGEKIVLQNPHQAIKKGIVMIHQELSSILEMTVSDNIFMGRQPVTPIGSFVKTKVMDDEVEKLFNELGITGINPKSKMKELSVSQMQMVEIVKAISQHADVIIMDEPTSAISDHEVEILFNIIGSLKKQGIAILYISHKMDEIFRITDEITVFRDGQYIGTDLSKNLNMDTLINMMVGRPVNSLYKRESNAGMENILEIENLSRTGAFQDVSFQVRKGEVFGLAGLMGAGRTEVAESIFGVKPATSGTIRIKGEKVDIKKPKDAIHHRLGFATEDRKLYGLFLPLSIQHNISIVRLKEFCKMGFVISILELQAVNKMIKTLAIKAPSINTICGALSGGNQQKVVLAKWLLMNQDILILDEPTRGIDVGVKQEIYGIIDSLAKEGKTIIMISSELPEILSLCDRVAVMHEGRVTGILNKNEMSQELIMAYASNAFKK